MDGLTMDGSTRKYSEQQIQIAAVHHFMALEAVKKNFIFFAVPNGGKRDKREASLLKAMGVRPGVHDLVFLLHGGKTVLIEMKAEEGRLSASQEEFHGTATGLGHRSYTVTASLPTQAISEIYRILVENGCGA